MRLEGFSDKEYYNLLVTGDEEAWEGTTYKAELNRFLEFTDMKVKSKFSNLEDDDVIKEIGELPCLFLNEIGRGDFGYVGKMSHLKIRSKYIGFRFEKIKKIPIENIKKIGFELDIDVSKRGITELHRTHWAIKKVNLIEELEELEDMNNSIITPLSKPKVFISYSWELDETKEIVKNLVQRLEDDGVEVIYDKKSLKLGNDMIYFMEMLERDESIKKVLVICDRSYQRKANEREGGVGTESEIIIDEVYGKPIQNKIIPIFLEMNSNNKPYAPTYLKNRLGLNFTSGLISEEYDELLKDIFN